METLHVSKEFVIEAYNAACQQWKIRIRKEFPTLVPNILLKQITEMGTYAYFHNKSLGNPLSLSEGKIHIHITKDTPECLFSAWDFVKEFLRVNPDYKASMELNKIILSNL